MCIRDRYIFRIRPGHWLDRIQLNANYTGAGRIYWTEKNTVSQAFYGTLNEMCIRDRTITTSSWVPTRDCDMSNSKMRHCRLSLLNLLTKSRPKSVHSISTLSLIHISIPGVCFMFSPTMATVARFFSA